ncbi:MAG TPA: DNA polymerase III subunit delta [Gaiellaceae bacterium]|nr:DNA polymerase III subunit delta [Gaiellaceae bacterium]
MATDALEPVYLIAGSDRPKVRRALRRLRARFPEESVDLLSADATSAADAAAACNALGLFGSDGGRLVIVEGVERWKRDDVEALAQYLASPTPGSVLALVADDRPRDSKLADLCGQKGQVLAYDAPKPKDLAAWVRTEFERLGARADEDAPRALVEIVGDDVGALAAEIDRIATWAGKEPVTRADVEALATPSRETAAWALTDAWGARDAGAALAACEAELAAKEPFLLAVRLASHVSLVRTVQLLAEEGLGAREIAKRVRLHEFRVRKALGHAANYSRDELDAAVLRLAELDAALKGASPLASELELERALVDLTAAGAHAA